MSDPERSPRLRTDKKLQTRSDLLANAIALFRRKGIRATRSAEISAAAGVSPATLFNYFATKGDLAEAWVRGEMNGHLEALVATKGDRSLRAGLRSLCGELAETSCVDRRIRLEAWRAAGRAPFAAGARAETIAPWIDREQRSGRLRSDLSHLALADMLVEALESGLVAGLARENLGESKSEGVAELTAELRKRVDLVLDGARKRNERVEAPHPSKPDETRPR